MIFGLISRSLAMSTLDATAPSAAPPTSPSSRISLPWVERLVSIDTTSRVPNLGLIEMVRDALAARGIASTLTHDAREGWANLFATVPAHDGSTASRGTATRSARRSATASCTAAAPAT
jgi:hypothetical protein